MSDCRRTAPSQGVRWRVCCSAVGYEVHRAGSLLLVLDRQPLSALPTGAAFAQRPCCAQLLLVPSLYLFVDLGLYFGQRIGPKRLAFLQMVEMHACMESRRCLEFASGRVTFFSNIDAGRVRLNCLAKGVFVRFRGDRDIKRCCRRWPKRLAAPVGREAPRLREWWQPAWSTLFRVRRTARAPGCYPPCATYDAHLLE